MFCTWVYCSWIHILKIRLLPLFSYDGDETLCPERSYKVFPLETVKWIHSVINTFIWIYKIYITGSKWLYYLILHLSLILLRFIFNIVNHAYLVYTVEESNFWSTCNMSWLFCYCFTICSFRKRIVCSLRQWGDKLRQKPKSIHRRYVKIWCFAVSIRVRSNSTLLQDYIS